MTTHDYDLAEPLGRLLERFNWWAAVFTGLWAAAHGMWRWVAVVSAMQVGLTLVVVYVADWLSAEAAARPAQLALSLGVSYWFGSRANRLLWNHNPERFCAVHRAPAADPPSFREKVVIALIFGPVVLLFVIGWIGRALGVL